MTEIPEENFAETRKCIERKKYMSERTYKIMKHTGGISIALGIVSIVIGVTVGVLTILNGAKLLRSKSDLTF